MLSWNIATSAVSNGPRLKDGEMMLFHTKGTAWTAQAFVRVCKKKSLFSSRIVKLSIDAARHVKM